MANILISGSAGFIGNHLYKHLKRLGHNVFGIDNFSNGQYDKEIFYCDVKYYRELKKYFCGIDIVFHLAAQISVDKSIENPEDTIATNVLGTQNVLELAKENNVKVVFASTSEVYGSSQKEYIDENHPLDCFSPYGASKVAADRMCFAYFKTYGLNVVVVRNFNTFGINQSDNSYGGVIAKFTKAALLNQELCIYGDGEQERDYMYISDAIQAYDLAKNLPAGAIINFGTGKTIKIIELANKIKDLAKSESKIVHVEPRKGEVLRLCADISKAKIFGFYPNTDFDENLKEYIEWVKKS